MNPRKAKDVTIKFPYAFSMVLNLEVCDATDAV